MYDFNNTKLLLIINSNHYKMTKLLNVRNKNIKNDIENDLKVRGY